MYVGIDVGGTKTLVGLIDAHGVIQSSERFPTPRDYDEFLQKVGETVAGFGADDFRAAAVGIPAVHLDRVHGVGKQFGNLPWQNVFIRDDLAQLLDCPVAVENDAKLAGLSEAMLRKDKSRVLYITVSTGIGIALTVDGKVDTNLADGGGRTILLEHQGKLVPWETFASGSAIVRRFGKKASDITDTATWQRIAHDLTSGLLELIALTEPDVIVVGGSVGRYFDRLKPHLEASLRRHETPLLTIPPLEEAKRPEEAVLYGCYDLVKEVFRPHAEARK